MDLLVVIICSLLFSLRAEEGSSVDGMDFFLQGVGSAVELGVSRITSAGAGFFLSAANPVSMKLLEVVLPLLILGSDGLLLVVLVTYQNRIQIHHLKLKYYPITFVTFNNFN